MLHSRCISMFLLYISIFQQVALDAQLVTVESLELGGVTGKAGCGITYIRSWCLNASYIFFISLLNS